MIQQRYCYLGGTIYYCAAGKGLKMLNLSDKSVSDIINRDMTFVYYVATSTTNNLLVDLS
jgi:hypothetical protein